MTRKVCIIPARMASSRFPGKPLAPLLGLPLILHVYHRCRLGGAFERVVVATCDREILEAVEALGGEAVMTADTHERCTDRVSEAIDTLDLSLADDDLVLMVQGDEVLVSPQMIDDMLRVYEVERPAVVNLASRLYRAEDHADPNTVKVVTAPDGRALYMSRAPIPSTARAEGVSTYQQTGVIGFSARFLAAFATLPQTPLERIESCDMMRVIEHGLPIQVVHTESETIGVDTPADLRRGEEFLASDAVTARYMTVEAKAP
jgi:3-deoxy-manno-octulosonate cytidylyltransferase (CMP-KDO synthetase)